MANNLLTSQKCRKIEQQANQLLAGHAVKFNQHEILLKIAKDQNIQLEEADMQEISGILFQDNNKEWRIVVNEKDSPQRKLFTLAHGLGHYFLHKEEHDKFINSQFIQTCYGRSEETKFQQKEIEASEFAGNLMMPRVIIEKELQMNESKKVNEADIVCLAEKFHVSSLAIQTRLHNLGYEF